jgi:hypothetical protein
MEGLTLKARKVVEKIRQGTFRPTKFLTLRGPHRLFSAVPQTQYATRYMPIDTRVLKELVSITWGPNAAQHPDADMLRQVAEETGVAYSRQCLLEFDLNRSHWWSRFFDFDRLHGIRVPDIPSIRTTPRFFDFFITTDGVGCSIICRRPKREVPEPLTPQTVDIKLGETFFKSIDPGLTDIWVGVEPVLYPTNGDIEGKT